jgi:gamma-glutamyltranspeptidase/glutathione hydrolase
MAPTFVFGPDGTLQLAVGSAGGPSIINYVAKILVAFIDWKQSLQQAIAAPNMGSRNRETEIERGSALESTAAALRAMGHPVAVIDQVSGSQGIERTRRGSSSTLTGGADPRREGAALLQLGNIRRDH